MDFIQQLSKVLNHLIDQHHLNKDGFGMDVTLCEDLSELLLMYRLIWKQNYQLITKFPQVQQNHFSQFIRIWYSKTCVKHSLSKRLKIDFQDQLLFNAGQKFCRMLQGDLH